MIVYTVYRGVYYESDTIYTIHSRGWYADHRAFQMAAAERREDGIMTPPFWDGYDWVAFEHYSFFGVHSYEVTP